MNSEAKPVPKRASLGARTDRGQVRRENQDAFLILAPPAPGPASAGIEFASEAGDSPPGPLAWDPGQGALLLLVADGMGGAAGGATASRAAARALREAFLAPGEPLARRLGDAVEEANDRLRRIVRDHPELAGMGTTLTAAVVTGREAVIAQVGDSRAYLVREGRAVQLTRDQSEVQELVDSGTLTEAEARRSPRRHVILQALGVAAEVDVVLTTHEIRPGDLLLLCSDGLSGEVQAGEIAEVADRSADPSVLCRALVDLANSRGGSDNITVVAARFLDRS